MLDDDMSDTPKRPANDAKGTTWVLDVWEDVQRRRASEHVGRFFKRILRKTPGAQLASPGRKPRTPKPPGL